MKYYFFSFFMIAAIALFATHRDMPSIALDYSKIKHDTPAIASKLLTMEDAKKVMGEPCSLDSNTFLKKVGIIEYKCEYTARTQDAVTGKTGKLYFMYEVYNSSAAAAKAYNDIYNANAKHDGVEKVAGLATEAYYHTDHTGFYFFLVRQNEKMFRLKLNKITSHSSEKEFKLIAKNIVGKF